MPGDGWKSSDLNAVNRSSFTASIMIFIPLRRSVPDLANNGAFERCRAACSSDGRVGYCLSLMHVADAKQGELSADQFDFDPVREETAASPSKLQVPVH